MGWREDTRAYLLAHEGSIPYMYLDVVGLVTVGVGLMLPTPESAIALKFVVKSTGVLATDAEKRQEWLTIHGQEKAHVASYYQPLTKLFLPPAEITWLLDQTISGFAANLNKRWSGFEQFPPTACTGLMDMIYSLGPAGLFRGFPLLCEAVDEGNWEKCAWECHRGNVSKSRNEDLANLFLAASRESTARQDQGNGQAHTTGGDQQ